MADHILETRIQLRYGTYAQWMNSNIILKRGEAAIASFPRNQTLENLSNSEPENTPPAIGIKIGDGTHYFSELPWVQAIAADVYQWAKSYTKPTYNANEIEGLDTYIENYHGSGGTGGSSTIAPRIYELVEGTGDNVHKFYLRYTEDTESGRWIVDTSTYIDLNDLVTVYNWIGQYNLTEYPNLSTRMAAQIRQYLDNLDVSDSEVSNQFVTSVSEEDGLIVVTRARPTFLNIAGTVGVNQGGTGKTTLNEDEVLIGNGTDPIRSVPIADEIAANNHLVPNYLIKAYVDSAVAGIEGAMHYVGDATVEPRGATNPQIAGYNFSAARPGDVILWEQKEYVWTGGNWRLLGDEGSYVVKGSIKDADIDAEANIAQSKIYNLAESLAGKVDKENGKGLSTNDYTTEDKTKLAGIEDNAQVNVIEHILLNDVEQMPHDVNSLTKAVELNVKEFDDTSRLKLGTIEEGANVNTIEGITLNGTAQAPDNNKVINLLVNEFDPEDKRKLNTIAEGAQVNTIETIYLNNRQVAPDQNKRIDLVVSEITQSQIDKLAGIEDNAQVNIIEGIKLDGQLLAPNANKIVEINTDPHTSHENVIESIAVNGQVIAPENKQVNLQLAQITPEQAEKLAGIEDEAQVNKIEQIFINNVEQEPNDAKQVRITLNEQTLGLQFIKGAIVPDGQGGTTAVDVNQLSQLILATIASTGNVQHLLQTQDTYVILDCGNSTEVID